MSEKKSTTFSPPDWLELQKQYVDACRVFSQFMPGSVSAGQFNPSMTDVMEQWWRSVAATMPSGNEDFVNKILDQGKIYYFLGEQLIKILNETGKTGHSRRGWGNILDKHFEEMKTAFGKIQDDAREAAHKMAGAWQLMPMDTWQRTMSLSSVMPGDFLGPLKHEDIQKMSDRFLSMPGVGYTRESQEQIQEGIRLWNEYQKVSQEYHQALCKVGMEAIDALRQKILDMARQGKELTSLRELYDLWVDCNEEKYAAFAFTPEYSQLYGRLTNALMAVKQHGRNVVDESLGALNVPTYKGINTLQKRQYEMGKQQKDSLKKIHDLQQEISQLHKILAQTKSERGVESPRVPSVKLESVKTRVVKVANKKQVKEKERVVVKAGKKHAQKDGMLVIKI